MQRRLAAAVDSGDVFIVHTLIRRDSAHLFLLSLHDANQTPGGSSVSGGEATGSINTIIQCPYWLQTSLSFVENFKRLTKKNLFFVLKVPNLNVTQIRITSEPEQKV